MSSTAGRGSTEHAMPPEPASAQQQRRADHDAELRPPRTRTKRVGLRDRARDLRRRTLPARIPLLGQSDYRPFLITTRSRTGSTMLVERLDSHPEIEADGELLQHSDHRPLEERLAGIFGPRRRGVQAYGFKIFHYHPFGDKSGQVWELLAERKDLRILHLRRRDTLRTLASLRIAEKAATWHRRADGRGHLPLAQRRIRLDPEDIRRAARIAEWADACPAERFPDHAILRVDYEDLVERPEAENRRILEFLGAAPHALHTTLVRQNSEALADLIENFDELRRLFTGTPLASWFEEAG